MSALWTWFVSTRVGRWIVGLGAIVAAFAATYLIAHRKGADVQKQEDLASNAQAAVEAANAAHDVQATASSAAQTVEVQAEKQPAPDPVKRDDFDNTGLQP